METSFQNHLLTLLHTQWFIQQHAKGSRDQSGILILHPNPRHSFLNLQNITEIQIQGIFHNLTITYQCTRIKILNHQLLSSSQQYNNIPRTVRDESHSTTPTFYSSTYNTHENSILRCLFIITQRKHAVDVTITNNSTS